LHVNRTIGQKNINKPFFDRAVIGIRFHPVTIAYAFDSA
jgi:hypothetical protein